jgi:hypothetical protein
MVEMTHNLFSICSLAAQFPNWKHIGGYLQQHHIIPRARLIEHWPLNLIRLCLLCHPARVHDQALVTMEDLWAARRYTVWELLYLWLLGELVVLTKQRVVYPGLVRRAEWSHRRLRDHRRLWERVESEIKLITSTNQYRLEAVVAGLERPWVMKLKRSGVLRPTPPWLKRILEGAA